MFNQTKSLILGSLVLGSALCVSASAASVTIGTANPGDGNEFPFGLGFGGSDYEQVYNASNFSGSMAINEISFFNTAFNPGGGTWADGTYSFYLSTTSVAVGALVGNDEGADNALFGSFTLSGSVPAGQISFSGNAFNYDPTLGNLLLDIKISGHDGTGNLFLDAMNGNSGTLMSRKFDFGGGDSGYGLVTEFGTNGGGHVPEGGSTLALLSMISVGLVALRRKFVRA